MKNKFWKKILNIEEGVLNKEGEEINVVYRTKKDQTRSSKPIQEKKIPIKDWLSQAGQQGQLVVDVYNQGNEIIIESTIAGVKPENIDITVEPDLIVIRGKRKKGKESSSREYYYQECFWGDFSRTIILPCPIKPDQVKANLKNGFLTVVLPKSEEEDKQVEVKE